MENGWIESDFDAAQALVTDLAREGWASGLSAAILVVFVVRRVAANSLNVVIMRGVAHQGWQAKAPLLDLVPDELLNPEQMVIYDFR